MAFEKYKKSEIALIQLKAAINLFNDGDYVSALTLSGISNEILSTFLRKRGLRVSFRFLLEWFHDIENQSPKTFEKYIYSLLNKTRNELKHINRDDDYMIEAEFKLEAEMFIVNSIDNYKLLFGEIPNDELLLYFYNSSPLSKLEIIGSTNEPSADKAGGFRRLTFTQPANDIG